MSETNEGIFSCKGICWIVSALLGLATYLILRGRWDVGFVLALLVALVVLIGAALWMRSIFCDKSESGSGVQTGAAGGAGTAGGGGGAGAGTAGAGSATAAAALDSGAAASAKPADAAPVAGELKKDGAGQSGPSGGSKAADSDKQSTTKKAATKKAATKDAPAKKTAVRKAPAKKAAAKKAPARKAPAAKAAARPVAADGKPELLSRAREGGADDLKQIKGVGPKLEALLNKLGVYHFDQIAGWRKAEIAWVDENLEGFKGRVSRDEWVKQAKVLARGGSTEFSKKVKKGGVY